MFDPGITEVLVIFVIGLLILGPERLPRVAAQLGRWMGKARRTAHQLRMQLEREMTMNDLRRDREERERKAKEADTAAENESGEAPDAQAEREYPPEEDANGSGHDDAGAVDEQEAANDADSSEQRRA